MAAADRTLPGWRSRRASTPDRRRRERPGPRDIRRARTGRLLALPAVLAIVVTVAFPIGWSFVMSLQSLNLLDPSVPTRFVGLENYRDILAMADFRSAMLQTCGFVVVTLTVELALAFPLALLLHRGLRATAGFRLVIALPLMVAPVVAALAWRFLFSDGYGFVDYGLSQLGLGEVHWFAKPWLARGVILVANLWLALPFDVLVLTAALAALPTDLFEAAKLDGASGWRLFRRITLPLLRPAILIILVIRLADAFRIFDLVYVLTGGGPGNSTDVVSTFIYRRTFSSVDFAGGAAASFMLLALMALAAGLLLLVGRRWRTEA
jgi:multiple sugar transport system permease protein